MTNDLVKRLRDISQPYAEAMPDGERLTALIRMAQESADAIERKDAALRAALEALKPFTKVDTPTVEWHLNAEDAFLRIKRFFNGENPFPEPGFDDDDQPLETQEWRDFDKDC